MRPVRHNHRLALPFLVVMALIFVSLPATSVAATAGCAPAGGSAAILEVLRGMFSALGKDDLEAYKRNVSGDFYIFSGGGRYDAAGFVDAVKGAHAQGIRFEWAVTRADIHVSCRHAWLTYVNKGSVDAGKGKTPTNWLESAVLEYTKGHWVARFIHSTEESVSH